MLPRHGILSAFSPCLTPHMNVFWSIILIVVHWSHLIMVSVMLSQAFGLREHGQQGHRVECNGFVLI